MGVNIPVKEDSKATSEDNTAKEDEASSVKSTDNVEVIDNSSDKKDTVNDCSKGMFWFKKKKKLS